jgi:hypothetical protein
VHYVRALSEFQHHLGLFGAVGEVGVHHGKFFMPIAGYALRAEPAVAMDLFEDQSANFDQSGEGRWARAACTGMGAFPMGADDCHVAYG